MRRQTTLWQKILAIHIFDKGLSPEYVKIPLQDNHETNNPMKKIEKELV